MCICVRACVRACVCVCRKIKSTPAHLAIILLSLQQALRHNSNRSLVYTTDASDFAINRPELSSNRTFRDVCDIGGNCRHNGVQC